ncbi:MAG: preprotein translocase subunit YajC [Bacillota bacterium]
MPNAQGQSQLLSFLPLVAMFAIMYFLMIRPSQVQQRKRQEMLSKLKKGDHVITVGGIYSTITEVKEGGTLLLKIADRTEIETTRAAVASLREQA